AIALAFGLIIQAGDVTGGEPWSRLPLLAAGLVLAGASLGGLGTLLGAVARESRTASLVSLLVVLPIVFLGLVPREVVPAAGYGSSGSIGTGTVACSTSGFSISFDPAQRVVVTSGDNKVLASASFTAASLGSQCKRVAEPKGYVNGGLGPEIRKAIAFRCLAGAPIRIHVNPITNEAGKIVGSNLGVGIGAPRLRV